VPVTSRVPAVLDYLVTLFQAAATLGQAAPPVAVYDGPVATGAVSQLTLWVGLDDPDSETGTLAAVSDRHWTGLGSQGEVITISCAAEAWSGEDDIRAMRQAAYGIVAAVETLLEADTGRFGGDAVLTDPGWSGAELRQNTTDQGAQARVSFTITLTVP
jgi:hypothetical protein